MCDHQHEQPAEPSDLDCKNCKDRILYERRGNGMFAPDKPECGKCIADKILKSVKEKLDAVTPIVKDDDPLKRWKAHPIKRSSVNPDAPKTKSLFKTSRHTGNEFIKDTIR